MRFDDCSGPATRIKYLTDGCLLRELLEAPSLGRYGVVVLDEAHERSLNTDILFGLLKALVCRGGGARGGGVGGGGGAGAARGEAPRRAPLRLVVTSATLDGEKFSAYFGDCPVLNVPGRCFPVTIAHALEAPEAPPRHLEGALQTVMQIHSSRGPGDILLFLTGQVPRISRPGSPDPGLPAAASRPWPRV